MLASHALILLGVPLARVLRSVREVRENRYSLLKGFFHGATDEPEEALADHVEPRLYTVTLTQRAAAIGKTLDELKLVDLGVSVSAVRRGNIRGVNPEPDTVLQAGDTLVLLGRPAALAAAELRIKGD